ncbi:MAG: endolytic transglycosylase MltG [Oscillospiraceae bacterium]|nr:endolytic transglycosylase MltG [Oscillospiraceae bacterium]
MNEEQKNNRENMSADKLWERLDEMTAEEILSSSKHGQDEIETPSAVTEEQESAPDAAAAQEKSAVWEAKGDTEHQQTDQTPSKKSAEAKKKHKGAKSVDKLFLDEKGEEAHNYTGDQMSERDYHPVRQSRESRTGCIGALMYFVFIVCVSVILASLAWMAASDALALNKNDFTAVVSLPSSIFETKTVEELDRDGNVVGSKTVRSADIGYVSTALKEAGLIQYKWLFELFCKISHADTKVTPGSFNLKSSFDYRALIQNMHAGSGSTVTIDVTFPEGFTMEQIFRRLEEKEVCSYEELMEAAANYKYNYSFLDGIEPGDPKRLEGFLFPDTYQFYVGMQASSAINKFLETFHYLQTADMLKQANDRGLSMKDVVCIASLIEKEAAVDTVNNTDDRQLISSVISNRLRTGMTLGIDASILYVFPEHVGAPTAQMLAYDSPYNTRLYSGLPPTPICNPSLASIKAALNPLDTDYLYYALNTETGQHEFFTNDRDFNEFVATQNYDG